jgi:hypothetical protein
MIYAKISNGAVIDFPLTEAHVRASVTASLPATLSDEVLEPFGFILVPPIHPSLVPKQTKDKRVTLSGIEKINNKWTRVYTLVDVPPDMKTPRINREWKKVRLKRDKLMEEFEWRIHRNTRELALGITPKEKTIDLHNYMQALANITDNPDPFLVTFPELPK